MKIWRSWGIVLALLISVALWAQEGVLPNGIPYPPGYPGVFDEEVLPLGKVDNHSEAELQGFEFTGNWKPFSLQEGLDYPRVYDIALVGDWLYASGLGFSSDGDSLYGLVRIHTKSGKIEVLARHLEYISVTGYIEKLLPYRGGVIGVGLFNSVDGQYARSIAYWDSTGEMTVVPMRGEGTRLTAAMIGDTVYMEGEHVSEPGDRVLACLRAVDMQNMLFKPAIGKLYRKKGMVIVWRMVSVGKQLWVFGFFDEVYGEQDTVRTPNVAVYNAATGRWSGFQVDRDSFPSWGVEPMVYNGMLYVVGYSLDRQKHCYRIDPVERAWKKIPIPEELGDFYGWFQDRGRLYGIFGGKGSENSPFVIAELRDTVWEVYPRFLCVKAGFISRIVSDGGRWWYIAGLFTMPGGYQGLVRYNPQTGEWEALGTGILQGSGDWLLAPIVADMAQDERYIYVVGRFSRAGQVGAYGVVRWNKWLRRWESLTPGCGMDLTGQLMKSVAVTEDAVYVTGESMVLDGELILFGRYDKRAQRWEGISGGKEFPFEEGRKIAVQGERVYVLGWPPQDTSSRVPIGVWNEKQRQWEQWAWQLVPGSKVYQIAVFQGKLIVGGTLLVVSENGDTLRGIARWNGHGWEAVGEPGDQFSGNVTYLKVVSKGLVVSGNFTLRTQRGEVIERVALWTGERWEAIPEVTAVMTKDERAVEVIAYDEQQRMWNFGHRWGLSAVVRYAKDGRYGNLGIIGLHRVVAQPPYAGGSLLAMEWVDGTLWIGGEMRYFAVPDRYATIAYGVIRWEPPIEVTGVWEKETEQSKAVVWENGGVVVRDVDAERLEVWDMMGRRMWEGEVREGWQAVGQLSAGIYGYQMQKRDGSVVRGVMRVW